MGRAPFLRHLICRLRDGSGFRRPNSSSKIHGPGGISIVWFASLSLLLRANRFSRFIVLFPAQLVCCGRLLMVLLRCCCSLRMVLACTARLKTTDSKFRHSSFCLRSCTLASP